MSALDLRTAQKVCTIVRFTPSLVKMLSKDHNAVRMAFLHPASLQLQLQLQLPCLLLLLVLLLLVSPSCGIDPTGLRSGAIRESPVHDSAQVAHAKRVCAEMLRQPDKASRIVRENCLPGVPSTEWDVNGAGDPSIQGFATDMSVNVGDTVRSNKHPTKQPTKSIQPTTLCNR